MNDDDDDETMEKHQHICKRGGDDRIGKDACESASSAQHPPIYVGVTMNVQCYALWHGVGRKIMAMMTV